jgi:hypothetical protein
MRLYFSLIATILSTIAFSQIGGDKSFAFLDVSPYARISALGGTNLSIKNSDLGIAYNTPSLLDSTYNNSIVATRASHFEMKTAISHGIIAYANEYKKINYVVGLNYFNYGYFSGYDEFGNSIGSFSANDFIFKVGIAKSISPKITVGAALKPIYSQYETYKSFAIATDYAITYNDTSKLFIATLLVRNLGSQIKPYTNGNFESLPFGIDIGISKKLLHAPFRFSLTYKDLQTFDYGYDKIKEVSSLINNNEEKSKFSQFSSNLLSHFIIGTEMLLFENMFIAAGCNIRKRQEMIIEDVAKIVGFSFGFGLKIYKFNISYGHERFHLAGGTNVLSLRTNLSDYNLKRK